MAGYRITAKTRIVDRGFARIVEECRKAHGSHTKVGLQQGTVADDMTDLVVVGAVQEFGAIHAGRNRNVRIPERPFMRTSYDENRGAINGMFDRAYGDIMLGKTTVAQSLGLIGEWFQGKIQAKIKAIMFPPNAPSTQKAKGRKLRSTRRGRKLMNEAEGAFSFFVNNPLIDTGQMRQSIRHVEVLK